ncbi:unnamed protein product [Sphagnum jensenii]|uniref:Uncharacterized protein n=1 Tax=Sphagnum jensenii TaxID=128206 RepID=A0ABP1C0Q6_9BRYO
MVCLLLPDSAEYVECYTLDKDAGQASAKLYTMELALADELVSIPVNSCFLHQVLLQGFVWSIGVSLLLGCMELEVLQQVSTFVTLLASSLH